MPPIASSFPLAARQSFAVVGVRVCLHMPGRLPLPHNLLCMSPHLKQCTVHYNERPIYAVNLITLI